MPWKSWPTMEGRLMGVRGRWRRARRSMSANVDRHAHVAEQQEDHRHQRAQDGGRGSRERCRLRARGRRRPDLRDRGSRPPAIDQLFEREQRDQGAREGDDDGVKRQRDQRRHAETAEVVEEVEVATKTIQTATAINVTSRLNKGSRSPWPAGGVAQRRDFGETKMVSWRWLRHSDAG